jgi:hypothetical protein
MSGRFHDRIYRLGETMAWWPRTDARYSTWVSDRAHTATDEHAAEACYTECSQCKAKLYAVIEFDSLRPMRVRAIGLEEDWPEGYLK